MNHGIYTYFKNSSNSRFQAKRLRNGSSGANVAEWDIENEIDATNSEWTGWAEKVETTIPNIEQDEMYYLRRLDRELKDIGDRIPTSTPESNVLAIESGNLIEISRN